MGSRRINQERARRLLFLASTLSLPYLAHASRDDPSDSEILLGFGLTTGAGLATVVGALILYSDQRVILERKDFLAGALALSAGVMIYVSFVEMFSESVASFHESGESESASGAWAAMCLFGGMALCKVLDMIVHRIRKNDVPLERALPENISESKGSNLDADNSDDTAIELGSSKKMPLSEESKASAVDPDVGDSKDDVSTNSLRDGSLSKMGLLTGLAVALHNFPEGLATFVGTLDDASVGASLAVAIAIHNIPEGVAVALPIYYGGGSKRKAVMWALLSGLAEPFGALLGYLILMDHFSDLTYGIVFGIVAGMMIYISFACLLPTAAKYDPENTVTTTALIFGMFIMALSIVLFDV